MEIIKKTVTREEVVGFKAADGTEFKTESECKKYEESAKFAITNLYKQLIVGTLDEGILFWGYDDHEIEVVRIKDAESVRIANMFFELKGEKNFIDVNDIGKDIFVGWDYDKEYPYKYGSAENIKKHIDEVYEKYVVKKEA